MYDMHLFHEELSLASGHAPEVRSFAPMTDLDRDSLRAAIGRQSWWNGWNSPE